MRLQVKRMSNAFKNAKRRVLFDFERKRKIANTKIYEDERDLYCMYGEYGIGKNRAMKGKYDHMRVIRPNRGKYV